jgi:hypothetical protein
LGALVSRGVRLHDLLEALHALRAEGAISRPTEDVVAAVARHCGLSSLRLTVADVARIAHVSERAAYKAIPAAVRLKLVVRGERVMRAYTYRIHERFADRRGA